MTAPALPAGLFVVACEKLVDAWRARATRSFRPTCPTWWPAPQDERLTLLEAFVPAPLNRDHRRV